MSRSRNRIRYNPEATETEVDVSYLTGLRNSLMGKAQSCERSRNPELVRAGVSLRRTIAALDRAVNCLAGNHAERTSYLEVRSER